MNGCYQWILLNHLSILSNSKIQRFAPIKKSLSTLPFLLLYIYKYKLRISYFVEESRDNEIMN